MSLYATQNLFRQKTLSMPNRKVDQNKVFVYLSSPIPWAFGRFQREHPYKKCKYSKELANIVLKTILTNSIKKCRIDVESNVCKINSAFQHLQTDHKFKQ